MKEFNISTNFDKMAENDKKLQKSFYSQIKTNTKNNKYSRSFYSQIKTNTKNKYKNPTCY